MKKLLRISMLLTIVLMGTIGTIAQQTFESGGIRYQVIDNTHVKVLGHVNGTSATGALNIPGQVSQYYVSEIADNAFKNCTGLTSVTFGSGTSLVIGEKAFMGCTGLTSIGSFYATSIGYGAFRECSNATGSIILNTYGNDWLTIGEDAFYKCYGITSVSMGDVSSIGMYAFSLCTSLTTVYLPENSQFTTIPKGCFNGDVALTDVNIPIHVTTIQDKAFKNCTSLSKPDFTLHYTLTSIGEEAFEGCEGITGTLTIPSTMVTIGAKAFKDCTGITLVKSLATTPPGISDNTFDGVCVNLEVPCGYLTYYNASYWAIHFTNIIQDCAGTEFIVSGLRYVVNDDNVTVTLKNPENASGFTGSVTIPESVTYSGVTYTVNKIAGRAFYYCSNGVTGDLVIPNTIVRIGELAFYNCSGLNERLILGTSINYIGESAFEGSGIHEVQILRADQVPTTIDYDAFNYNSIAIVPCGCLQMYLNAPDYWNRYFDETHEDCEAVESSDAVLAKIYPNPSNGIVKIEAENIQNVTIFNEMGQKVFEMETSSDTFEYNFNGTTGMFLIRVETANGVATKRVTVL